MNCIVLQIAMPALTEPPASGRRMSRLASPGDNSLFKAELVRNEGPWKGIDDLEIATAE
jgi:putative transposase